MDSRRDAPETAPTIVLGEIEDVALRQKKSAGKDKETLGARLARLRRERGLTQVELAEKLGAAQPVISGYERDELRLHGQVIVALTSILRVSADVLLGLDEPKAGDATIRNRRLLRRLKDLDRLPKRDQQALLRTIDAFLQKAS